MARKRDQPWLISLQAGMQPPGRYSLNHYYGLWPEREGLHLVLQLRGISDVSKWNMDTSSKLSDGTMSSTVLTDRIYRYWDVAMQGDGTFLAIVCLW